MKEIVYILLISLIIWPFAIFISAFIAPPSINWATEGLLTSLWLYPVPILISYSIIRSKAHNEDDKVSYWALLSLVSPISVTYYIWALSYYFDGMFT